MRSSHRTPSYPNSNEVSELCGRSFRPGRATPHNGGHRIIRRMRCTAYCRVRTHPHHKPNKRRRTGRQSARRRLRTDKENEPRPARSGQGTRPGREIDQHRRQDLQRPSHQDLPRHRGIGSLMLLFCSSQCQFLRRLYGVRCWSPARPTAPLPARRLPLPGVPPPPAASRGAAQALWL